MIESGYTITGIIIGLAIAAFPGPISLLCLKRTLSEGRLTGFVCGLGVTTADGLYGFIAGFGLTTISRILLSYSIWLQIVGGIFLCVLGIRMLAAKPSCREKPVTGKGLLAAYGSTLLLTISNPVTILSFAGIMAGLGIGNTGTGYEDPISLVTGICIGSILWWMILSYGAGSFQTSLTPRRMILITKGSGFILCMFGIIAFVDSMYAFI
jgi:threonine/homoserine/homoserine lactone efflux protein